MPINRTVEIRGQAYATTGNVLVSLSINGTQYFNGLVPSTNTETVPTDISDVPHADYTLGSFQLSQEVTGNVDLSVTAQGGTLVFHYLKMNYTCPDGYIDPNTGNFVVTVPSQYNFTDSNVNDTIGVYDGKTNIIVNGAPAIPDVNYGPRGGATGTDQAFMGDAPILITDGTGMTCTYAITFNDFPPT